MITLPGVLIWCSDCSGVSGKVCIGVADCFAPFAWELVSLNNNRVRKGGGGGGGGGRWQ